MTEPPGDGWRYWTDVRPEADRLIEIWRADWGNETGFTRGIHMSPETNVHSLYWRYAE